jgi:hypothetical protein
MSLSIVLLLIVTIILLFYPRNEYLHLGFTEQFESSTPYGKEESRRERGVTERVKKMRREG